MDAGMHDEAIRLDTLDRYDLLDTHSEAAFDRITRIAAQLMGTPVALITLVDHDRQWFKSRLGLDLTETPRSMSLCAKAIEGDLPFIVGDAADDPRFCDNPLVTGPVQLRFYLGVPLRMHDGQKIGTLCVIDHVPRVPTAGQIAALADLARLTVSEIELRHVAMTDSLTGALTRRAVDARIAAEISRSQRYGNALGVIMVDIDHFKRINDRHGHGAGDLVLQSVVARMRSILRNVDVIGRIGGEEFLVLLPETTAAPAVCVADRLRSALETHEIGWGETRLTITCSFGVTSLGSRDRDQASLMARADTALYAAKRQGRNRVVLAPP